MYEYLEPGMMLRLTKHVALEGHIRDERGRVHHPRHELGTLSPGDVVVLVSADPMYAFSFRCLVISSDRMGFTMILPSGFEIVK